MIERQKQNRFLPPAEYAAPCVRELMLPIKSISLDTDVLEILTLFQTLTELPALPIIDQDGKFFGIISRRNYFGLMSRPYARELFNNKSLLTLLKIDPNIFSAPLIAYSEDQIDQVMLDFLIQDPNIMNEAIPVMGIEGAAIGVVKISDMMLKLSESQGTLINTMHQLSVRLKEEVASAATLQRNLLRPEHIDLPGLRGLSTLITSSEVGGDFYDYYAVEDRWIVMLVGDVSGHGVAAGTMVSAAKSCVNLLESDKEKVPGKILTRLSNTILQTAHQSLLMTMFAVCLDTQTGELQYANAGHQFAYVYRSITGSLETLELGGLPLGNTKDIIYEQRVTEMDVGDCLFLYTDGIVEEENSEGECFGYERLEELLSIHAESSPEVLRDSLLASLSSHIGRNTFEDDVTIFFVEHHERRQKKPGLFENDTQDFELVRIVDSFFRAHPDPISPRIARQNLAFLAEENFSDLIPELAQQGIRRVLMRHHSINRYLGWNNLLSQHQNYNEDDLTSYFDHPRQNWVFQFTKSDDKDFILDDIESWLLGMSLPDPDRVDSVILLLDELIENGLYAAPRDGKRRCLYPKGTPRDLVPGEILNLRIAVQDNLLGVSLIDNWGTLTPSTFLNRVAHHVQGLGLDSGKGGGGLYLIWRMSDYLQLRVLPHKQTQICAIMDLGTPFEPEIDKSFQFLYHTEINETINNEQFEITSISAANG